MLCLFNISHFSPTVCSEAMAKKITKSRPMMSLIARVPSNIPSSTSESPGKRTCGNQNPWSAKAEREDRLGQPVVGSDPKTASDHYHEQSMESFSSASYSKSDDNQAWSSQELKTDTSMCDRSAQPVVTSWRKTRESQPSFFHEKTQHNGTAQSMVNEVIPRDRSGQPVVIPQRGARPQQFIIGNDETELELSVESRSFLNRVNDQVRKRQKRSSLNVTEDREKHSMIWGMFMSVPMESAVFMGKNYLNNCHSIANTKDLTLKQMFDISAKLVSKQDEIYGVKTIDWENSSWKYLSLIGEERNINLQRTKVYVFSDSVLCLGKIQENRQSNDAWEQRLGWFNHLRNKETLTESTASRWTSSEIFSQDSARCSSMRKSKSLLFRFEETPENFKGRILFMSMFNDISCGSRDNEKECMSNANLVSQYLKRFGKGQRSFIGPGSEKKWYSISEDSPQGEWDNDVIGIRRKRMSNFPCYKSIV